MMYLLDVNALVALGLVRHEFHGRVKLPRAPGKGSRHKSPE